MGTTGDDRHKRQQWPCSQLSRSDDEGLGPALNAPTLGVRPDGAGHSGGGAHSLRTGLPSRSEERWFDCNYGPPTPQKQASARQSSFSAALRRKIYNRFLAKARPDEDFRYRSKATARSRLVNAIAVLILHGRSFEVWIISPALCRLRRSFR